MGLAYSALFREASKQFKAAAYREFAGSEVGRLHATAQQALRSPGAVRSRFAKLARQPIPPKPDQVLRELTGVDFRSLIRDVAKYSRGSDAMGSLVKGFLRSLGPIGTILENLALGGTRAKPDLDAMAQLLRAHGYTVLPPDKVPGRKELPAGVAPTTRAGQPRKVVELPMAGSPENIR